MAETALAFGDDGYDARRQVPDVPDRALSLVTDENMGLYATLDDCDAAMAGEDYQAIVDGFGATLSGEEERIAARAVTALLNLEGGRRLL